MKSFYSPIFLFLFSLCGCGSYTFSYIGSSRPPVENVEVHVDEGTIKKKYEIIGKGYAAEYLEGEALMEKAIRKAKEKGADAIFFRETHLNTLTVSDTQRDTVARSYQAPVYAGVSKREILFLKYTE